MEKWDEVYELMKAMQRLHPLRADRVLRLFKHVVEGDEHDTGDAAYAACDLLYPYLLDGEPGYTKWINNGRPELPNGGR